MWYLYGSIAIGGVLLAFAPPKDVVESKSAAPAVAFMLTWPIYLILDIALQKRRGRKR
jgi:hypothetical protein